MKYQFQLTKDELNAIRRLTVAATYVAVNQETEETLVSIVKSTIMIEDEEKIEFHQVANLLHILACARYGKNIKVEKKLELPKGSLTKVYLNVAKQAEGQDSDFVRKIMCWYDDRQQA